MSDSTGESESRRTGKGKGKTRWEEYRVSGDKVVGKLKELVHEGNVRHIVLKNEEGRTLIELPVSVGVAGALLLPMWAAVGAVAAVVTKCSIEVERDDEDGDEGDGDEAGNEAGGAAGPE
jgi:uncharacterized protein DUF4342